MAIEPRPDEPLPFAVPDEPVYTLDGWMLLYEANWVDTEREGFGDPLTLLIYLQENDLI